MNQNQSKPIENRYLRDWIRIEARNHSQKLSYLIAGKKL
jgi:hypothetical protein